MRSNYKIRINDRKNVEINVGGDLPCPILSITKNYTDTKSVYVDDDILNAINHCIQHYFHDSLN